MDGLVDLDRLLELAIVDPAAATAAAHERLAVLPSDRAAERLRTERVLGAARRELGDLDGARELFERLAKEADALGDRSLCAAMSSSLAFVLARLGRLDDAIALFRSAEPDADAVERARLLNHLGIVQYWRGELSASATTLAAACCELDAFDPVGAAKARVNLGGVLAQLGRADEAVAHLQAVIAAADGGVLGGGVVAAAHHNLGFLAMLGADVPTALAQFEAAEAGFVAAGADSYLPRLWADHARALAAAALYEDASSLMRRALDSFATQGQHAEAAGGLLNEAELRLAMGDLPAAADAARDAERRLAEQGRDAWVPVAATLRLLAEARAVNSSEDRPRARELVAQLTAAADDLDRHVWTAEALTCRLSAALLASSDTPAGPDPVDAAVRVAALTGRPADRILLARVDATHALARGDATAARDAISRGLAAATETQAGLGSIETRAHASVHGHDLVELGARLAVADGNARELLTRIETTRVIAARLPAIRPAADAQVASLLAELRRLEVRLRDPDLSVEDRSEVTAQRARLERDVRTRTRSARGDGLGFDLAAEIDVALQQLGRRQLLAHAKLDDVIHAVTVIDGVAELHVLGSVAEVRAATHQVDFALRRLNRAGASEASRAAAAELLFAAADQLAELVVPPTIADSDEPVVVVPTALVHDVPWGLLPPLAGRPVSVNASFTGWGRAMTHRRDRERARSGGGGVGLVAGPQLDYATTEVDAIARWYPDAVRLVGDQATGDAFLDAFGSCRLIHVACHGRFRSDNPLFSSVVLADGSLNVYDLEQSATVPDTVVLSACSLGGSTATRGGALLGLATALTTLGVSTVIAPLTPISDLASVTAMQRLHAAMAEGTEPAQALAFASLAHDLTDPTAAAFVSLGL